jgi:isopenicillin-N N-acyltransferase-like protein
MIRFESTVAGPFERGQEFGTVHAAQVAASAAAYQSLFAACASGTSVGPLVDSLGAQALRRVEEWVPALAAEIQGIALGAGLPVEHVAAINARTEILSVLRAPLLSECSTVVSVGRLAMQNWDWFTEMSDNFLQWTIPHPDGRRVTTMTEFGMVGKIGVNERGLGTLFNILHHRDDGADVGVPVHVVARQILDTAGDVFEGLAVARDAAAAGVCASTSITIVDGSSAVAAEFWPGGLGTAAPDDDGLLLRTNHFLSSPACDGDTWEERGSDTMVRLGALAQALKGTISAEDALSVLSDHDAGVCAHPAPSTILGYTNATLATVTLDLPARSLTITPGLPCTTAA